MHGEIVLPSGRTQPMNSILKLESLGTKPPSEITQITAGALTFGREPENNIVIDSAAISRKHASISLAGSQWIFRDFASTNGSWLNGVQVLSGQFRLLRNGDVVKLADFLIRVVELPASAETFSESSLLVFFAEKFEQEFALTSSGARFTIGGPGSNLVIDPRTPDVQEAVVVKKDGRIELTTGRTVKPFVVNGLAAVGTTVLNDRDEISFGAYRIVVSDPAPQVRHGERSSRQFESLAGTINSEAQAYERPHLPEHLRRATPDNGWESEAAKRRATSGRRFVFSSTSEGVPIEGTLDMDRGTFADRAGFEMSPSQRFFSMIQNDGEVRGKGRYSEQMLIMIGVLTFVVMLSFVVFFIYLMLKPN